MNCHGTGGNRTNHGIVRIKAAFALNRICDPGSAVQAMRKDAEQMRVGNKRHGTIFDRSIVERDPDSDLPLVEFRIVIRFILVPRRWSTVVTGFVDGIIRR